MILKYYCLGHKYLSGRARGGPDKSAEFVCQDELIFKWLVSYYGLSIKIYTIVKVSYTIRIKIGSCNRDLTIFHNKIADNGISSI